MKLYKILFFLVLFLSQFLFAHSKEDELNSVYYSNNLVRVLSGFWQVDSWEAFRPLSCRKFSCLKKKTSLYHDDDGDSLMVYEYYWLILKENSKLGYLTNCEIMNADNSHFAHVKAYGRLVRLLGGEYHNHNNGEYKKWSEAAHTTAVFGTAMDAESNFDQEQDKGVWLFAVMPSGGVTLILLPDFKVKDLVKVGNKTISDQLLSLERGGSQPDQAYDVLADNKISLDIRDLAGPDMRILHFYAGNLADNQNGQGIDVMELKTSMIEDPFGGVSGLLNTTVGGEMRRQDGEDVKRIMNRIAPKLYKVLNSNIQEPQSLHRILLDLGL